MNSKIFGKLKHHRSDDEFRTTMDHRGTEVEITVRCEEESHIDFLLPFAEKMWKRRVAIFKTYREHIVTNLLGTLNGMLDCGEPNPAQLTKIQLQKIVSKPTEMTFFTDDGDTPALEVSGSYHPDLDEHTFWIFFDEHGEISAGQVVTLY